MNILSEKGCNNIYKHVKYYLFFLLFILKQVIIYTEALTK